MAINRAIIFGTAVTAGLAILLFEVLPLVSIEVNFISLTSAFQGSADAVKTIGWPTHDEDDHIIAVLSSTTDVMQMGKKRSSSFSRHPNNAPNKDKLIHSSFRIEENVIKALKKASTKRQISLSSLVNMTLKNYIVSQMYFQELGFIPVSKPFLRKLFSRMSPEYLRTFGKEMGMIAAEEYINYLFPKLNSVVLLEFLEIWFSRFQSCQHTYDNISSSHTFYVTHEINLNFSIAMKYVLKALAEPIIKANVEFKELTSNVIVFSFEVKS